MVIRFSTYETAEVEWTPNSNINFPIWPRYQKNVICSGCFRNAVLKKRLQPICPAHDLIVKGACLTHAGAAPPKDCDARSWPQA